MKIGNTISAVTTPWGLNFDDAALGRMEAFADMLVEKNKVFGNRDAEIHALVVGTGATAKTVVREFERENDIRTMCVLNYKELGQGTLFDGIPVVNGMDNLKGAIGKYKINYVVLASASMPQEIRNEIKELCRQANVEAQDYSGFFQSSKNALRQNAQKISSL